MIKSIYKTVTSINWPVIIVYGISCTLSIACWYYLIKFLMNLNIFK